MLQFLSFRETEILCHILCEDMPDCEEGEIRSNAECNHAWKTSMQFAII